MGGFLEWVVARRLLTLTGFGVILLGAFVPWPSLAIAAVVIVLGAVLLAVQIPIAMRDATEQLDGVDEPGEQWQPQAYPQYQAPEPYQPAAYQQPASYQQPAPVQEAQPSFPDAPAVPWQPKHIPQYERATPWQREPSLQVPTSSPSEPERPADQPATPWRPQNIPQYHQPER